jgi:hypothetical protein
MQNNIESLSATSSAGAGKGISSGAHEEAAASGRYSVECRDSNGNVRWSEDITNLVTIAGKNDALDKYLAGSAYTAAWYVGLIGATGYGAGPAPGDTAGLHAGWTEDQNYSQGARPTAAWGAASAGSKSLSTAAVFSISQNTTIKGCFLISNSAKGGVTGVLYSAGLFAAGDKVIQSGDTLNVSYTASL